MFINQFTFLKGIIIIYIMLVLVLGGLIVHKYNFNYRLSIGSIFIDNKIFDYLVNFVYLDGAEPCFILKKGLPVLRVKDDNLKIEFKDKSSVIEPTLIFITGVPISLFKLDEKEKIKPVIQRFSNQHSNSIEKKLEAEGRHENEKVDGLDFWQTTPSIEQKPTENLLEKPNINDNRFEVENKSLGALIGIYHTHSAENYDNKGHNSRARAGELGDVTRLGGYLAERLEKKYSIAVTHSNRVHDRTYARSYIKSLETGKDIVEKNQNLKMLFDIHRDAIGGGSDSLITTTINGKKVARIMIVVTNDEYGLPHQEWRQNVQFAQKLARRMNKMYPGLLRDLKLISNRRYNQHLHPHSLLLEVGGARNTFAEAKRSADLLANVLASMIKPNKFNYLD